MTQQNQNAPVQYVSYSYDIPKATPASLYPTPGLTLRRFAARVQQSVWYMPETAITRTEQLTKAILDVHGIVDVFRFDTREYEAIRAKSLVCLAQTVENVRKYVEASIQTTAEKLAEAKTLMSIASTNSAIRYQQAALNRALQELVDAEECALVFDLTGDVKELIKSVRTVVKARSDTFVAEKDAARACAQAAEADTRDNTNTAEATEPGKADSGDEVDPAALGFGLPDDTSGTGTEG